MRLDITTMKTKHIKSIKPKAKGRMKFMTSKTPTNKFLDSLFDETSLGRTENGALTLTRSGSPLVDFFAQAGAMRNNRKGALDLFKKAFAEDRQSAVRILFYLRDVRGGQGERDLFRNCLEYIGNDFPKVFDKIVEHVSEYGRWDDLFFDNESALDIVASQLKKDKRSKTPSLLAKWLPTINASSLVTRAKARFMAKKLGLDEIEYRKTLVSIRKKIGIVEAQMSAKKWKEIDYSRVPSQASRIYKDAFKEHDEKRYEAFIAKAEKGEVKINSATLYPYQIYKDAQYNYSKTLEALWKQLPDFTQGKNALVVADVSGSMSGDPMAVSVSLALYFAERNKGQFQNHFLTFSANPKLQRITGSTLRDKMNSIESSEWGMNTDLEAVFNLIINTAVKNDTPVEEMPETIYIISDMEFDSCVEDDTNYNVMKKKFEANGYKLPNIVFWQVNARGGNLPVKHNENGVAMVSGFSPSIFKLVVENKTPEQVMFDVINSERYSPIKL